MEIISLHQIGMDATAHQVRPVRLPLGVEDYANVEDVLGRVSVYAENEFQPLSMRSLAVGDVVEFSDDQMRRLGTRERYWVCMPVGWMAYERAVRMAARVAA
jgi:hypothetical protein